MNRLIIGALIMLAFASFATPLVSAAEPAGAFVNSTTDLGRIPSQAPGTVNVTAGNITIANLDVQQTTFRWVGLMGNVSGSIGLGDADAFTIYQWAAEGNIVFAANASSVDWSSLTDADEATVIGIAPFLTGVNDAYNETFTGVPELIGSGIFGAVSAPFAVTNSAGATVWKTYSLWDASVLIWAGKVVQGGISYRNSEVDYQMIIPEDGTGGSSTPTTYYLWVENI